MTKPREEKKRLGERTRKKTTQGGKQAREKLTRVVNIGNSKRMNQQREEKKKVEN